MRSLFLLAACLVLMQLASATPQEATKVQWGAWRIILPFDNPGGATEIAKSFSPEKELKRMRVGGPGPKFSGKHKGKAKVSLQWHELPDSAETPPVFPSLDFRGLLPAEYTNEGNVTSDMSVAYIHRTITSSKELELPMALGTDDSCRVWLNGKLIHNKVEIRSINPEGDPVLLSLSKGTNHILIKVANGGGGWGAHLHPPLVTNKPQASVPQEAINAAIDRGVLHLLKTQLLDGSWDFDPARHRNGHTALAAYALMKSGLIPDHPAVRRALLFVKAQASKTTYSVTCEMLALGVRNTADDRRQILELGERLEDWQFNGFAYPEGTMDLSNSQYGTLGLLLAQGAGAKISPRTWAGVLRSALRCQNSDGGFGYSENGVSNGSMTVAGLTVLNATIAAHGKKGLPVKWRTQVAEAQAKGLDWLIDNFRVDANPNSGTDGRRWRYYYLYGIERMAALGGLDLIGDRDWYAEGAGYLIRSQRDNDSWGTEYGEETANTCFALIFLARATAAITGEHQPNRHQRVYATDIASAPVLLRATGDTPLNLWISQFSSDALEQHSQHEEGGHGIYIEKVSYFADGKLVHELQVNNQQPWKQERFAVQHVFELRGDHTVHVEVQLSPNPEEPSAPAPILKSEVLKVRVDETLADWMFDYPDDAFSNLLFDRDYTVEASSMRNVGDDGTKAFDNFMSTGWACAGNDPQPKLGLRLHGGLRADRLILSHRTSRELLRNQFDVATEIELHLNGDSEPLVFPIDPNEELKTVLILPKAQRISSFSITVTERRRGTQFPGSVGFAEVELRLGE